MNHRHHLKLNQFRELYKSITKKLPKPLAFLVLGFLVWLEKKYIDAKTTAAVNKAIREYEEILPPSPSKPQGVYSESGSSFFDEMSISTKYTDDPS